MTEHPLMPKRHTGLWFSLDTNRINARRADNHMNQLELWHTNGVVDLYFSEPAADEIAANGDPDRTKKLTLFSKTLTLANTPDEKEMLSKIAKALLGRPPKTKSECADVEIVFHAHKYPGSLITQDGNSRRQPKGILGSRHELKSLGIQVFSTVEALNLVRRRIAVRDRLAKLLCEEQSRPLPNWVGID